MSDIIDKISKEISFRPVSCSSQDVIRIAPALRMMLKKNETSIVVFKTNDLILRYIENKRDFFSIFSQIKNKQVLDTMINPIHVNRYKDIDKQYSAIKEEINKKENVNVVAIRGIGVFIHGETKEEADRRVSLFLDLLKVREYNSLKSEISSDEIENYFIQKYSRRIVKSKDINKKFPEKIAIVTGAAQGFGKGISESLAKEGANVVLVDININMAEKNALKLNREHGDGKFIAFEADVTDEAQVKNMILKTVSEYGGIDIFISNAGILRAGDLGSIDLKSFELSTEVNYTAFFICTKYACQPMKIQYKFNNSYFTDIIQVNSKSGLEGSKKNFTYAGSKFGGIGLTQSFALELVEYNIKVNAVCPGNFFEGPLWSDPEKGLFIQYLKSNKVPGARTIEDVRKFYESKVPMKRGCRIEDLVKAIFYIIEQKYETGQAIPVTGGQVMLH
jgi:NAD(P)-dependent dehydrogenase (short-subunit alcohol dehydrogenase family)